MHDLSHDIILEMNERGKQEKGIILILSKREEVKSTCRNTFFLAFDWKHSLETREERKGKKKKNIVGCVIFHPAGCRTLN